MNWSITIDTLRFVNYLMRVIFEDVGNKIIGELGILTDPLAGLSGLKLSELGACGQWIVNQISGGQFKEVLIIQKSLSSQQRSDLQSYLEWPGMSFNP